MESEKTGVAAEVGAVVGAIASVGASIPFLILALIYGGWLLAWSMLGHEPRPNLDDPKDIPIVCWMQLAVMLASVASIPLGIGCFLVSFVCLMIEDSKARAAVRFMITISAWATYILLVRTDPGRVLFWFFD